MGAWRRIGTAVLLTVWAAGCSVSPQPLPPAVESSEIRVEGAPLGPLTMIGDPGAVTPGGSVLELIHLDGPTAALTTTTADDGSFSLSIPGTLGNEYRLQAFHDDQRSAPTDVAAPVEAGGPVLDAPRPLTACLELSPALELDLGDVSSGSSATRTVGITNRCSQIVSIERVSFRVTHPGWSLAGAVPTDVPIDLAPGTAAAVDVTFAPTVDPSDDGDQVLFVTINAPETGRRPITLRANPI